MSLTSFIMISMFEAVKSFQKPGWKDSGWMIVGALCLYNWYYVISRFIQAFSNPMQQNSGSCIRGTFLIACVIFGVATAPFALWVLITVWRIFVSFLLSLKDVPYFIKEQMPLIKRIWQVRGFKKYKLFGGFSFYIVMRTRVLAYLFAFFAVGIVTWFFIYKQKTYSWDYRKIRFYYGERIEPLTLVPGYYYTFTSSSQLYALVINGEKFSVGTEYIKDAYGRPMANPEKKDLYLSETWNIYVKDTTKINFGFYTEPIHQIFAQSFEMWKDKTEGTTISLTHYWQREGYENTQKNPSNNSSKSNKKNQKKNNK